MPATPPLANLAQLSLEEIAQLAADKKLPPIASWHPANAGESHMVIKRDGSWWHEGGKIERPALVNLFATILRREDDGQFYLVTPHEKQWIEVEDAPFIAVECKTEGDGKTREIAFRLNTGELVMAGPDNPLRFEDMEAEPAPYLLVRDGLEARLSRPVFYELAEIALEEGHDPPGIWSKGQFFAFEGAA
jgi:uncharacterized protein